MTEYDLVIRGGSVVDGTGLARYRADVAIKDGLIREIGKIPSHSGAREIDAEGAVVAPGFIDSHTHYDAQVFWNEAGTNSSWHGVTTAIMGNCGFTLAPNRPDDPELVIRNLEKSEDIPGEVLRAGIGAFSWETFGEYLDKVDTLSKGINYAGYVGHSALRTWAMGERAFSEEASASDLELMKAGLREALRSGALGFSTSRSGDHRTINGDPVASRLANWEEVVDLVRVLDEFDGSILQFTREGMTTQDSVGTPSVEYQDRLRELIATTGAATMFTVLAMQPDGSDLYDGLRYLDDLNQVGRYIAHTPVRAIGSLLSFRTRMPFDVVPEWAEVRRLNLEEQRAVLANPARREELVSAARRGPYPSTILVEGGKSVPNFRDLLVLERGVGRNPTVGELCGEQDPVEYIVQRALASDFDQMFERHISSAEDRFIFDALKHPGTIIGGSDAGAHSKQICTSDLHTYLLAYWVRETGRLSLEEAVRMCSSDIAQAFGLADRGTVARGKAADLVVFEPDTIAPKVPQLAGDLPGGDIRVVQGAIGIRAVVVNGELTQQEGVLVGSTPGRVLRRSNTAV